MVNGLGLLRPCPGPDTARQLVTRTGKVEEDGFAMDLTAPTGAKPRYERTRRRVVKDEARSPTTSLSVSPLTDAKGSWRLS